MDHDWSRVGDVVCDWLGARWREEGLPVCLYFIHHSQQRSSALWDVVVRPGGEPVVPDVTPLCTKLKNTTESNAASTLNLTLMFHLSYLDLHVGDREPVFLSALQHPEEEPAKMTRLLLLFVLLLLL